MTTINNVGMNGANNVSFQGTDTTKKADNKPSDDKKMKTATKLMIGATALVSIAVAGHALTKILKKGNVKKIEKSLNSPKQPEKEPIINELKPKINTGENKNMSPEEVEEYVQRSGNFEKCNKENIHRTKDGEEVELAYKSGVTGITTDGRVVNLVPNSMEYPPNPYIERFNEPEQYQHSFRPSISTGNGVYA